MNRTSDILIIGGGIIGLAIAVELQQRGQKVTVLSRSFKEAAGLAAAGMLAPQAEQIPAGPFLELALRSRALYPDWIAQLEALTELEAGYYPCGILAPVFQEPATILGEETQSQWLDSTAIRQAQPGLGPEVAGGWWYPQDGQVDNQQLMVVLQTAAQRLGVNLLEGVTVVSLIQQEDQIQGLQTSAGRFSAQQYILATGAWVQELLPLPVLPVKGQMLSLEMPARDGQPWPLQRVLFGPSTYLVPRRQGRLIIGATVETVDWQPHNTPLGVQTLLERAIKLYPPLAHWAIAELWWGFRPGTPDQEPLLGQSPWQNLMLAIGHYRNGILLAPVTAQLIAAELELPGENPLIKPFSYQRFICCS
jgi:thiazole synthase